VIIRAHDDDLLLISQPDHAALAERIIAAWQRDGFPGSDRRDIILYATRRHDDGWVDVDRTPLVDRAAGRVLDYVHAPDDVRRAIWPAGIARVAATPYAAALVARHALHIFEKYQADPEWRDFFEEMTRARDTMLAAASPLTAADLDADYFFVRMADLLSLQFCDDWREPQRYQGYDSRWDGERLTVAPDPFEGRDVPLTITARRVPRRAFAAGTIAADAFAAAPQLTIAGVAGGHR
jgi:hypothetical protein